MNRHPLRRFPATSVALGLALMVLAAALIWHIHVFDLPGVNIMGIEENEIGEVLLFFLLVIPAFFIDRSVGRDRKHEAQRVRFALAAARIGVWEWDLKSDVVTSWSSDTGLGLSPEEAPPNGRAFFALVHPDDRQALGEATDRAKRAQTDLVAEYRTVASDGVLRWVHAHARFAYEPDGKAVSVLGVNFDISDRKALEAQLLESHRQADRLRVLRATMRTVQDIVNNNLNQLQLLRLEADGHVSDDTLSLFDHTIRETAAQLTALGNLGVVVEKPMASGMGLDVTPSAVLH